MCDPIKSIANRLRELREVLELSAQEVAESCHLRVEEYMALESGESDISVNVLQTIARRYGISLDVLMFGEEPKMNAYFITRAGAGVSVERRKAYKYEALASGFRDRKADPFIVTVEPAPADAPMHLNSHEGQEMNYVRCTAALYNLLLHSPLIVQCRNGGTAPEDEKKQKVAVCNIFYYIYSQVVRLKQTG